MTVREFLNIQIKKKRVTVKDVAIYISKAESTFRRFLLGETIMQFTTNDRNFLAKVLKFSKTEKRTLKILSDIEKNDSRNDLFRIIRRKIETESPEIYRDKMIRKYVNEFLYLTVLKVSQINEHYIGNYSLLQLSILLNMPDIFEACLFYEEKTLSFTQNNPKKESAVTLLSYLDEKSLNKFKEIIKEQSSKINYKKTSLEELCSINPSEKLKNYSTPLYNVIYIKNNAFVKTLVAHVKTPYDLREIETIALLTDHRHNFFYQEIKQGGFDILVPQNTYFIVALNEKPKNKQQAIFIYKNKVISASIVEDNEKYVKLLHFTGKELKLEYNDDLKFIGTVRQRTLNE